MTHPRMQPASQFDSAQSLFELTLITTRINKRRTSAEETTTNMNKKWNIFNGSGAKFTHIRKISQKICMFTQNIVSITSSFFYHSVLLILNFSLLLLACIACSRGLMKIRTFESVSCENAGFMKNRSIFTVYFSYKMTINNIIQHTFNQKISTFRVLEKY